MIQFTWWIYLKKRKKNNQKRERRKQEETTSNWLSKMVMTSGFQETKSAGEYNIVKDKTEYDLVYNHRELLLMACLSGKMLFCVLFL